MDSWHPLTLKLEQPLDLTTTLASGQAFRWRQVDDWHYGVVQGELVALRQTASRLEVQGSSGDHERTLGRVMDYLRLDDDLEGIYAKIDTDPHIHRAIDHYRGLRILRQDPWECLVSFICSANSSVARISETMTALSREHGVPLKLGERVDYSFPTPQKLVEVGEAGMRALKMGFRAPYVAQAAERVARGELALEPLRRMPYTQAKEELMALRGVGDKVADCVLLFSLDKLEACPIDRHVRRSVEQSYLVPAKQNYKTLRAWALEQWGPLAGYAQQYLFQERRLAEPASTSHPGAS